MSRVSRLFTFPISIFILAVAMGASPAAYAITNLNPSTLSNLVQSDVDALIKTVAIGADHRAYQSARPLGVFGLDIGAEVTAIQLPTFFKTALTTAGVTQKIPTVVPLPRLSIHKGLPWGVDLGASYISYQSFVKLAGFDAKYAFLKGDGVMPAVAVRGGFGYSKLYFLQTRTWSLDLVASKRLAFVFEPYIGAGLQSGSGDIQVPINVSGLSTSVSGHSSVTAARFYFGFPIKLVFLHLTPQVEYSTAKITTYGLKLSLAF